MNARTYSIHMMNYIIKYYAERLNYQKFKGGKVFNNL